MLIMVFSDIYIYINIWNLLAEILNLSFFNKEENKVFTKSLSWPRTHAQLSPIGLEVSFHYRKCFSWRMPQMSSSWHSASFSFFSCNYHNSCYKACPGWSESVPTWLGSFPPPCHEGLCSNVERDRFGHRGIWQLTKAPIHLTSGISWSVCLTSPPGARRNQSKDKTPR